MKKEGNKLKGSRSIQLKETRKRRRQGGKVSKKINKKKQCREIRKLGLFKRERRTE